MLQTPVRSKTARIERQLREVDRLIMMCQTSTSDEVYGHVKRNLCVRAVHMEPHCQCTHSLPLPVHCTKRCKANRSVKYVAVSHIDNIVIVRFFPNLFRMSLGGTCFFLCSRFKRFMSPLCITELKVKMSNYC